MFKNHKPAHKICGVEIRSNFQIVVMLPQTAEKFAGLIVCVVGSARLPPAFRHSFADVNRKFVSGAIEFRVSCVKRIRADVINRINTASVKGNRRRLSQNRRAVKKANCIFNQFCERIVSITVFRPIKWPLFHCKCSDMPRQVCDGNLSASIPRSCQNLCSGKEF